MHARHHRRKRLTPIVDLRSDHVWSRALEAMGLQPLHPNSRPAAVMEGGSSVTDAPEPTASSSTPKSRKTTILDLPIETQKAIFEYSSPPDLLSLALVSKHFRHIAAEHLYRTFHIVFPNDDDSENDTSCDPLAAGLETFVTSEYDYGKFVKEIIVEPSCGREQAQHAYRDYLADTSCGKFLNTLLVLTLRKTKALETFTWDIRVEPSRQVFKALHDLKVLQNLHIRLHAGHSVYKTVSSTPPSITSINTSIPAFSQPHSHPTFGGFPPINTLPVVHLHPIVDAYSGNSSNQYLTGINSSRNKTKAFKTSLPASGGPLPTLSGFKNLRTLAVLDMDSLDYISEIHQCIVRSWTTLNSLSLSFSESLSSKSRKPLPDVHSDDDSDLEDDFTQLVPPPGAPPAATPLSTPNDAPSKALKALEERKKQEAVLSLLLGVDLAVPEPVQPQQPPAAEPDKKPAEDPKRHFVNSLAPLGKILLKVIKDEDEESEFGKAALDIILKASRLYVESVEGKPSGSKAAKGGATSASSTISADAPSEGTTDKTSEANMTERGLFDEPEKKEKKGPNADADVSNPDDIDIEVPEASESASEAESLDTPEDQQDADEPIEESEMESVAQSKVAAAVDEVNKLLDGPKITESEFYKYYVEERTRLQQLIEEHMSQRDSIKITDTADWTLEEKIRKAIVTYLSDLVQLELRFKEKLDDSVTCRTADDNTQKMSEYVRKTRELNLQSLALYLIPLKSSVLLKAINLRFLRSITLLEVGHQSLFWASVAKENRISPIPLRKIYTDNVTLHFLALVHQLECVEELLMVERKQNSLVESITPKTTVTIDHLRRVVLKRHASTLKVLMIQNDDSSDWDLNSESAILICQRAKKLEELAVTFGSRTMHTLLQFLPGLTSLRVLHTLQFRQDDTCGWVMREFRKFAVDTVCHNPHMKLEYLALGEAVERLVRHIPKKVDRKGKGKAKQSSGRDKSLADLLTSTTPTAAAGSQAALNLIKLGIASNVWSGWDDSDEEDLRLGGKNGLLVETVEGIEFSDVPGVRIFEKDALYGRL